MATNIVPQNPNNASEEEPFASEEEPFASEEEPFSLAEMLREGALLWKKATTFVPVMPTVKAAGFDKPYATQCRALNLLEIVSEHFSDSDAFLTQSAIPHERSTSHHNEDEFPELGPCRCGCAIPRDPPGPWARCSYEYLRPDENAARPELRPRRLVNAYFDGERSLRMALLAVDIDAHDLKEHPDLFAEWRASRVPMIEALMLDYPGLWHETEGGYHLLWMIDFAVQDASEFRCFAEAFYAMLISRGFDRAKEVDAAMGRFAQPFRLPFVFKNRERHLRPEIHGELLPLLWSPPEGPAGITSGPRKSPKRGGKALALGGASDCPEVAQALDAGRAAEFGGAFAVFCPKGPHSGGLSSQTIVWCDDGIWRFNCQSTKHARLEFGDWVSTEAARLGPELSADDAAPGIREAMKRGGIGQAAVAVLVAAGTGKSHIARELCSKGAILEGLSGAILTPTTALATQHRHAAELQQFGGISADIPDRMPCKHPATVRSLQQARVPGKIACIQCPDRPGCKTNAGVGDPSRGFTSTHEMLHKFGDGFVFVDELPNSLLEAFEIEASEIVPSLDRVPKAWREAMLPFATWLAEGEGVDPPRVALEAAQHEDEVPMASIAFAFDGKPVTNPFLARVATAILVRKAARLGSKITRVGGKVRVTRLSEVLLHWKERGGVLMAADAPKALLLALRPDVEVCAPRIKDGCAGIERVHVTMAKANTRALKAEEKRIEAVVKDVVLRANGRRTAIFCAKAFRAIVARIAPDAVIGTYGALRGLDDFMSCEVFATIGENWTNGDAIAELAGHLGVDPETLWRQTTEGELLQAHGRARDPRRATPCLHLHYGAIRPGGWTLANTRPETWNEVGRRKIDPAEGRRMREDGASWKMIAKHFDVSEDTAKKACKSS